MKNSSLFPVLIVLISLGLGLIGLLITSFIPMNTFPPGLMFGAGLTIGGIIVALAVPRPGPPTEDTVTLYVGNLPYRANEAAVSELFSEYGQVVSVRLMKDRKTGKRRGFGFVEMAKSDADSAIDGLNEKEFHQRTLKVRLANARKPNDSADEQEPNA